MCLGFEFKRSTTPGLTKSLRSAFDDLRLKEATIIHAGSRSYRLARRVKAVALVDVLEEIKPLR